MSYPETDFPWTFYFNGVAIHRVVADFVVKIV